ncbi:MAG TPA: SusE domain-containing protein, partial [Flavisolibacter sp.]|nr:SusE domain-containing protein [Flavisolibacter sp.]
MKKLTIYFSFLAAALLLLAGCSKVEPLPYYNDGSQVTLSASKTSVVPTPADSAKAVLTLNWTSPNYGSDPNTYKFVVQIDTTGRNFAKATTKTVYGTSLSTAFTGAELNNLLLNYGFALGSPVTLDMRVISSYANNNEPYLSNVVKVAVTPYSDPSVLSSSKSTVTPALPTANDSALTFFWTPSFKGYTGTVTYSLQYDSTGRNFRSVKEMQIGAAMYSKTLTQAEINTTAIDAGVIGGSAGKIDYRIKATTAQGAIAYSNVVPVTVNTFVPVPANLFIVGDATAGGWNNPVPTPSQQFTKVDAYSFAITTVLNAGKSYLLLPVNGSWDHKYGAATDGTAAGGATLLKDGAVPGSNTPAPATTGLYKIVVNFQTNKMTVTPVTVPAELYIVGDATAGGWSNPVPTPSQQFTKIGDYSYAII